MISNSNNKEINQIKNTDLFTLLKTVYPLDDLKFKKLSWAKEKKNLFTDEKIQFNQKEKTLLKSLLLTEIPQNLRKKLWLISSGAKRDIINNPNYYNNLIQNFPDYIPCPYEKHIDLDIKRTYPKDPFFKDENNLKKLKNVLLAYSRRCSSIGYCQGFNLIVGKILKICQNEEETFWIFTNVIENYLPINYYSQLCGMIIDSIIIMDIINNNFKDILIHLNNLNGSIFINNLINNWLISLFLDNLSECFQLIIWDFFLLEGNIVFFKAIYGLMKMISKDIFKIKNFENLQRFFKQIVPTYENGEKLIYFLCIKNYSFNHLYIKKRRLELKEETLKNISQKNIFNINDNNNEDLTTICDLDWPICIKDKNYNNEIFEVITYKTLIPPIIKNNYFFDKIKFNNNLYLKDNNNNFEDEKINKEELYSQIIIQRNKHLCNSELHSIKDILNELKNYDISHESSLIENITLERKKNFSSFISNSSNYISKEVNEEQINDLIKKTHTKKENLKETQETKLDNLINQEKN